MDAIGLIASVSLLGIVVASHLSARYGQTRTRGGAVQFNKSSWVVPLDLDTRLGNTTVKVTAMTLMLPTRNVRVHFRPVPSSATNGRVQAAYEWLASFVRELQRKEGIDARGCTFVDMVTSVMSHWRFGSVVLRFTDPEAWDGMLTSVQRREVARMRARNASTTRKRARDELERLLK